MDEHVKDMSPDELWLAYRAYIWAIVVKMWQRMPNEDKLHESWFGLVKAQQKFDPTRGVPFHTYLAYWVLNAVRNKLAPRMGWPVRIPQVMHQRFLKEYKKHQTLPPIMHWIPSSVLCEESNKLFSNDEGVEKLACARAEGAALRLVMRRTLDDRSCRILSLYYGLDGPALTLEGVGRILGLTRERIRQIRNVALAKLREVYQRGGVHHVQGRVPHQARR